MCSLDRKPQRTLHIDPHGSASLVKNTKDVHRVPKQLLQCSQRVKESIANFDKELKCFTEDSSHNKKPTGLSHYKTLGENGMLSIRTCKSIEDRLPPIDGTSGVHTVDVFCPKTPQRLYFTPVDNSAIVDSDDSTSVSSSSSEGFLPNSSTTASTRSSSRNKPVAVVGVHNPADQASINHKEITVVIIPNLNSQNESLQSIENQSLQSIENQMVSPQTNSTLTGSLDANSRSCSPLTIKESNQQKPLKDFSLRVVKLPQSMLGGSYLNTSLQNSPTEAKIVNDEGMKEGLAQLSFQMDHAEANLAHHSAKPQKDANSNSRTETDSMQNSSTIFSTEDVEIDPVSSKDVQDTNDPLCEDVQDNASVTTDDNCNALPNDPDSSVTAEDNCNALPNDFDSHGPKPIHFRSIEEQCKPSSDSHKEDSTELKDSFNGNNISSSVPQNKPKSTKHKTYKSEEFVASSCSEPEDTPTNVETHKDNKCAFISSTTSQIHHRKVVSTKLADYEEENNAVDLKQTEFKTKESQTLQLSPSPKSLPIDDDLNHNSPLPKRKLFSSDKENSGNQNSNVNKKSSNKPKLRSKGIQIVHAVY